MNWASFSRAYSHGHDNYLTIAKKCSDFVHGDQWDPALKAQIEADGRPCLTINEILRVVNTIQGQYSTTQADVVFKPRGKGATAEVAHTLTRLFDQILEANDYHESVEPAVFLDGIVEDRGYFDVRVSTDENIQGEVKITALDPRSVVLDENAKEYDPATWTQVHVDRWMSLDDITLWYGQDKADQVTIWAGDPSQTFGATSVRYESFGGEDHIPGIPAAPQDEHRIKAVRVIDRQYRKLRRVREFVHPITGETRDVPDTWTEAHVQTAAANFGLIIRKALRKRVRWTVSADNITLHDDWSPYNDFTVVPYFPMFRRGQPSGVVRHLLDPQEQFNKSESQGLHVVNTTANSGWVIEAGSLVNMTPEELAKRGSTTGLVLVYGRNRQAPDKILPNPVPPGLENFSAKAKQHIQNIPGVAALVGQVPDERVSGVKLDRMQTKELLGLQVVFDNLDFSRKLLARRVLDCVQKYYTEHRIFYVTNWRDPEMPEEEVQINRAAAGMITHNVTVGEFEVVASSAPARDTAEDSQFAEVLQLREAGIQIPDHHVILASRLPGKRAIAEEVKQMQGLGEPSPMQQQLAELQIRRAVAEIEGIEAQAAEREAQAMLWQSKAQVEITGEQRAGQEAAAQHMRELARIKADLMKQANDLANKIELAQVHTGAKEGLTRYQQLMGSANKDLDRRQDLNKALLSSRTTLAAAAMARDAKKASAGSPPASKS